MTRPTGSDDGVAMKNRKKILAFALIAAVIAIVAGGSLAWFTAEDELTNTFTFGDIRVKLHDENARPAEGVCGDVFTQDQLILPILNTDAPQEDEYYMHKVVHVENDGGREAYVRVWIGVPAALTEVLHLDTCESGWVPEGSKPVDFRGMSYTLYSYRYDGVLAEDAMTPDLLTGVYMDAMVDLQYNEDAGVEQLCVENGDGSFTFYDFDVNELRSLLIPVYVQATQTVGFDDAASALNTVFPDPPASGN